MIAFIRGIIDEITEESVVIDTGSMGYNIRIQGMNWLFINSLLR